MNLKKNNNGFSLIASMVALSVAGVVVMTLISSVQIYANSSKGTSERMNIEMFRHGLTEILDDQKSCTDALLGQTISNSGSTLSFMNPITSTILAGTGTQLPGYSITKIYTTPVLAFVDANTDRITTLKIQLAKNPNSETFSPKSLDVLIGQNSTKLYFRSNASGVISKCSTSPIKTSANVDGTVHCAKNDMSCPGIPVNCWRAYKWACNVPEVVALGGSGSYSASTNTCLKMNFHLDTSNMDGYYTDHLCHTGSMGIYWNTQVGMWFYGNFSTYAAPGATDYVCLDGVDLYPP